MLTSVLLIESNATPPWRFLLWCKNQFINWLWSITVCYLHRTPEVEMKMCIYSRMVKTFSTFFSLCLSTLFEMCKVLGGNKIWWSNKWWSTVWSWINHLASLDEVFKISSTKPVRFRLLQAMMDQFVFIFSSSNILVFLLVLVFLFSTRCFSASSLFTGYFLTFPPWYSLNILFLMAPLYDSWNLPKHLCHTPSCISASHICWRHFKKLQMYMPAQVSYT